MTVVATSLINEEVPVLTVTCSEPEGLIDRSVYPMMLTPRNLEIMWNKIKGFRTLFAEEVSGDYQKFLELFLSQDRDGLPRAHGLFWRVDDFVGIFYMTHITDTDASIHYSFFDRRHHGRDVLTRRMIKWAFETFKFQRLTAEVPAYTVNTVEPFIRHLGFTYEGRRRKAVKMDGSWFDVKLYGVLNEEAKTWA